ncbi:MAG: HTH domain-containing protein [Pseudomonadota bacterium]
MRAARLLHILLILQNRGRQSSVQLATELEVSPRTILRDVDAMTEAGLPIIVHQGHGGGIELGFNYRSRLTGMDQDEAEALGVMLFRPAPELTDLGLTKSADRARAKLVESFPDKVRVTVTRAKQHFTAPGSAGPSGPDPRVAAIAKAVRGRTWITLRSRSANPKKLRPVRLWLQGDEWAVQDADLSLAPEPQRNWGDLNISARPFD